jgi:hypothetical protein
MSFSTRQESIVVIKTKHNHPMQDAVGIKMDEGGEQPVQNLFQNICTKHVHER